MGAAYDPVEFDQLVVRREHLDTLIDQELLTQAAVSMGLDVDPKSPWIPALVPERCSTRHRRTTGLRPGHRHGDLCGEDL